MKIVRNKLIPPKGFAYINLFGVLFTRRDKAISDVSLNHETIHTRQMKEMLYVPFYLLYVLEWLVKLIYYRDAHKAYRELSFEREAYRNQGDLLYLENRKKYCWIKLIKE